MTEEFYIGQIFEGEYPPEAAEWCNERGDCFIEEIEAVDEVRRFQIKEIPPESEEEKRARRVQQIKEELKLLDEQRIRALAEPSIKDEETGETWLEYYNAQVVKLREELNELEQ